VGETMGVCIVDELPLVETAVSGACLLVSVRGTMDYATLPQLSPRLHKLIAPGERAVVLDLAEVTFCDSVGLNLLLEIRRAAQHAAVPLALARVPRAVHRVLDITGATQVLQIFTTVADAEAALAD
jgi:anti-anti-sigma factor